MFTVKFSLLANIFFEERAFSEDVFLELVADSGLLIISVREAEGGF